MGKPLKIQAAEYLRNLIGIERNSEILRCLNHRIDDQAAILDQKIARLEIEVKKLKEALAEKSKA